MSFAKLQLVSVALVTLFMASAASAQGVKNQRSIAPQELIPATTTAGASESAAAEIAGDAAMREDESVAAQEETAPPPPVRIAPSPAITVSTATNISLDTLGIYDEKTGGVAFDVWDGSAHAQLRTLFGHVPQVVPSATIRNLLARLLLSSTKPPASENIQQNVFYPRIEALLLLDEVAQAQRLLELVPQNLRSEKTARAEYTARLLRGDVKGVCDSITTPLKEYGGAGSHWQKLSIYCHAYHQETAKMSLGLDVLGEQNIRLDEGFVALVEALSGKSDAVATRFSAPLALDDAALIALSGKDAFPETYLERAPLPVLRLVSGNNGFNKALREKAATGLAQAKASETPAKTRAAIRDWAARQFAQSPQEAFDYARALRDMASRGGKAEAMRIHQREHRLYTLLRALGFGNIRTDAAWEQPAFRDEGRVHVAPALRAALLSAAHDDSRGEAILLLAIAAGQVDNLAVMDDAGIADMVQALQLLGYQQEARALAAEALAALF